MRSDTDLVVKVEDTSPKGGGFFLHLKHPHKQLRAEAY